MQDRTLRKEYYRNKLTKLEIAEKYGMGESTVSYYFTKYGLRPLKGYERMDLPPLNGDQHSFLIGTMLGDGSLELTHNSRNARLHVEHSVSQVDYALWKYHLLRPYIVGNFKYRERMRNSRKSIMCGFKTMSHPIFTDLHRMFYDRGVKVITNEVASQLTPISIATWLMDDGGKNGNCIVFATYSFTRPELERLQCIMREKFSIYTTLQSAGHRKGSNQKCYVIYVLKKSMGTLIDLVTPHIVPSMTYKVDFTSGTSETVRGTPNGEDTVQART